MYLWPNLRIFRVHGILRKKAQFFDESTDFFVMSSATTPPRLLTRGISRAPSEPLQLCRVNFFGYYPKSQDFSDFRLRATLSLG